MRDSNRTIQQIIKPDRSDILFARRYKTVQQNFKRSIFRKRVLK